MKNLVIILSAALAFACSPSDQGKQFTNEQAATTASVGSLPKTDLSEVCPFEGVSFNESQEYNEALVTSFNKTLKKHIKGDGLVSYFKWRKNKRDLTSLCNMMSGIRNAKLESFESDNQKAFIINAYNTFALSIPLSSYEQLINFNNKPVKSVANIGGLGESVLNAFEFNIAGKIKTLSDIENKLLIPFSDSRVLFATSCPALGCPAPTGQLLTGDSLDSKLTNLASSYVNNRNIVGIDSFGEGEGGELLIPTYIMSKEAYFNADNTTGLESALNAIVFFLDQEQLDEDGLEFKKEELLSNDDELWFIDENTFNWSINEKL